MKRLCIMILLCAAAFGLQAQTGGKKKRRPSLTTQLKKNREEEKFLEKQWWLGIRGGGNLTKVNTTAQYSAISPVNYPISSIGKQYGSFDQWGSQITMEGTFYFRQLSLSLQPTYRHALFGYTNTYTWTSPENTQQTVTLTYDQLQKTDHLLIPLIARFDLTKTRLRPYLQGGGFVAFLLNANKRATITGIDLASGGTHAFEDEAIVVGAKDLFAPVYYGLVAGAGVHYHQGNIRLTLDLAYQHGMTNLVSAENRYNNDRLSGVGDVMDDLTMDNLQISLGCLFPLRFLGNNFKSLDKK